MPKTETVIISVHIAHSIYLRSIPNILAFILKMEKSHPSLSWKSKYPREFNFLYYI